MNNVFMILVLASFFCRPLFWRALWDHKVSKTGWPPFWTEWVDQLRRVGDQCDWIWNQCASH